VQQHFGVNPKQALLATSVEPKQNMLQLPLEYPLALHVSSQEPGQMPQSLEQVLQVSPESHFPFPQELGVVEVVVEELGLMQAILEHEYPAELRQTFAHDMEGGFDSH